MGTLLTLFRNGPDEKIDRAAAQVCSPNHSHTCTCTHQHIHTCTNIPPYVTPTTLPWCQIADGTGAVWLAVRANVLRQHDYV